MRILNEQKSLRTKHAKHRARSESLKKQTFILKISYHIKRPQPIAVEDCQDGGDEMAKRRWTRFRDVFLNFFTIIFFALLAFLVAFLFL